MSVIRLKLNSGCLSYHNKTRKEKVDNYKKAMEKGVQFPPVKAYRRYYGDKWTITDGAHRSEACRLLGIDVLVETTSAIYFLEKELVVK